MKFLGWAAASACAFQPDDKADRLRTYGLVEQCIGLLVWFCGGAYWLKPWPQCLYEILHASLCCSVVRLVTRAICYHVHPPRNQLVAALNLGRLSSAAWLQTSLSRKLSSGVPSFRQRVGHANTERFAQAADAHATEQRAGIGGWWLEGAGPARRDQVRWLSVQLDTSTLPPWFKSRKSNALRSPGPISPSVVSDTWCWPHPAVDRVCINWATMQLQLLARESNLACQSPCVSFCRPSVSCCQHGVSLTTPRVAGVRNAWADSLSRGALREIVNVFDLLQRPWAHS